MKRKWLLVGAAALILLGSIWWFTPVRLFREGTFSVVRLSYSENGTQTHVDARDVDEAAIEQQLETMRFRRTLRPFYRNLSQIQYQLVLNKQGTRFPNVYLSRDGSLDLVQDHPLDGLITVRYRVLEPDGLRELLDQMSGH